ncbi:MAG: SDR family NAD(P)-dependent oxidoreductase [Lautropia sp.]
MPEVLPLLGRRALVTGAAGGIGEAIAMGLARQGADLVLHHLDDPDEHARTAALAGEIEGAGRRASRFASDFVDAAGAERLARFALAGGEAIDIVVANAALERRGPWERVNDDAIAAHVAANFASLLCLLRILLEPMRARGWGRVVALGSVLAKRPRSETVVYAAMKAAQLVAIRAIARDVAVDGVTLNVVSPGAIEMRRTASRYADDAFRKAVVAKIPAGRQGQPSDCLAPVLMLCSDGAGYITGADIPVDGGWSLGDAPGSLPATGSRATSD